MGSAPCPVERLEAALQAWGIGTYEWERDRPLMASSHCLTLYGWEGPPPRSLDELWSSVHPDDRAQTVAVFERALRSPGENRFEHTHRVALPDGKTVWLCHRVETSSDGASGTAPRVSGSVMDVTEKVKVEQELGRTLTRFEEAVRGAQFGIFDHNHLEDPGAQNVYWSPRMREIFGVPEHEPSSAAVLLSRIPVEDHAYLHEAVRRAHDPDGDGYYDVEHRYLHPRDGLRWLLTRSSTHFGEVGGKRIPVRTVGAIIDVTARRRSEQENEQRAQILDATSDFVAMFEPDGHLVYLNRAGREFLGMAAEAPLRGRSLFGSYASDSLRRLLDEELPAAERHGAWRSETELVRHDGSVVTMSQVLLSHRTLDGRGVLFSTIARDISRERQLEENMRQSQKMEAVGRLAGGIAHDFNNMLCAILSFAHLAKRAVGPGGHGREELQEIIGATERAAALTQQLLAFSRRQVLRPRIVDVNDILDRMNPMIRRLVGEDIVVELSLARGPLRVKADPTHLEQVLLNLAINARDSMLSGGRLKIASRQVDLASAQAASQLELSPGSYAVIAVSDEGGGMDAATRARIFEPFFTTKPAGRGTGLGLATAFGIVKQSGGTMIVHSEVGRGSTFEAYVPSSEEPLTAAASEPRQLRPMRPGVVLVAEDEPAVRRAIVAVLQQAGHLVLDAPDAHHALELASSYYGRIDLLLTDVVMPMMSGKELADRVTALRPEVGVLYMSGYADRTLVHRGILEPGVHLLTKPITPEQLLTAAAQVLHEARMRWRGVP